MKKAAYNDKRWISQTHDDDLKGLVGYMEYECVNGIRIHTHTHTNNAYYMNMHTEKNTEKIMSKTHVTSVCS